MRGRYYPYTRIIIIQLLCAYSVCVSRKGNPTEETIFAGGKGEKNTAEKFVVGGGDTCTMPLWPSIAQPISGRIPGYICRSTVPQTASFAPTSTTPDTDENSRYVPAQRIGFANSGHCVVAFIVDLPPLLYRSLRSSSLLDSRSVAPVCLLQSSETHRSPATWT